MKYVKSLCSGQQYIMQFAFLFIYLFYNTDTSTGDHSGLGKSGQDSGIPVKTFQTDSAVTVGYEGHSSGFFFSLFLVIAVLCIGGYLFWHNRKKVPFVGLWRMSGCVGVCTAK